MKARICVYCPTCDMVRVPAEEVTLRHCTDDGRWDYWFQCPVCNGRSAGDSSLSQALEAFAAGSPLERWRLPAELNERHDGPPLDVLDLLALRLALTEPDWMDRLERTRRVGERRPPAV